MRTFGLTFIALAVLTATASAQPAAGNGNAVLQNWEQTMSKAKDITCEIHRATVDKSLNTKDNHQGFMLLLRDGNVTRARYELSKTENKQLFETLIVTDKDLYEYTPNKPVRVRPLPKDKNGAIQQPTVLSLVLGVGAQQRFDMSQVIPKPPDPNYYYFLIKPKLADDKNEFREARLTILRTNGLPRQIWIQQPNGNETTWDFTNVRINTSFNKKLVEPPAGK